MQGFKPMTEQDNMPDGLIIYQHEIDRLEEIRLELHEIAKYNPQLEQSMFSITSKLWPIVHKNRASHLAAIATLEAKHRDELRLQREACADELDLWLNSVGGKYSVGEIRTILLNARIEE